MRKIQIFLLVSLLIMIASTNVPKRSIRDMLLKLRTTTDQASRSKWSPTGSLRCGRTGHSAILLRNGNVLVAGGLNLKQFSFDETLTTTAELYDPSTRQWTYTGSMHVARYLPTISLLTDGRVLVTGGIAVDEHTGIQSAELYDPITRNWTQIKNMHEKRLFHTATVLSNGKVMVVGGVSGFNDASNTYELYDPVAEDWTLFKMPFQYAAHQAVLLENGKLLIVGGTCDPCKDGASALFDPNTGNWTWTGSMLNDAVWFHTATVLENGNVLIAGGQGGLADWMNDTYLYNPLTEKMRRTGYLKYPRYKHTASLLQNGKVFVTGGESVNEWSTNSTELYDPLTGEWSIADSMIYDREIHTATVLMNGEVLIAAGESDIGGHPEKAAEIYDSSANVFTLSFHSQ